MRHRGTGGSAEYAMHDVYYEREKGVTGWTRDARTPRLPSAAQLKGWIEEQLGSGRDTALKTLANKGLQLLSINDITPIPHNGCKPKKVRRV